jgi:NTE family protein
MGERPPFGSAVSPLAPFAMSHSRYQVGVALSGGTAKSVAHIGVLKALEEHGIEVTHVAATSGGSIIGSLFAAGISVTEIEERASQVTWKRLAGITLSRLGFLSSEKIQEFLLGEIGDTTFSDLRLPFAIVATNLATGGKKVFREGKVAEASRASCTLPQIYSPVIIDGEMYVDGGMVEYLPIETLSEFGPMFRLGVNLGAERDPQRPRHVLQLIMQIMGIVAQQNFKRSEAFADFLVAPDLRGYSPFALDRSRELMKIGYEEMQRRMPELLRALERFGTVRGRVERGLRERRLEAAFRLLRYELPPGLDRRARARLRPGSDGPEGPPRPAERAAD